MIDTMHAVQTPEGVDLALPVAGPAPRGLAYALDLAVQSLGLSAVQTVFYSAGRTGFAVALSLIAAFLINWFYPVLFEVLGRGQTPGKRVVGLRVVHENGTPIGWSASLVRNFLMVADFLPLLYLAGVTSMCLDSSFRRLGDLAAGSLVVHAPRPRRTRRPAPAPADAGPAVAPPLLLTLEEQRAVIAFAERAALLSPERADELAAIPAALTAGEPPRARLVAMAAFLLGRSA